MTVTPSGPSRFDDPAPALDPPPIRRRSTLGPDRPGQHACLRCGHHWNHTRRARLVDGRPRFCPLCHSPSWWLAPAPDSRHPSDTDWSVEQARIIERQREKRRRKRVREGIEFAIGKGLQVAGVESLLPPSRKGPEAWRPPADAGPPVTIGRDRSTLPSPIPVAPTPTVAIPPAAAPLTPPPPAMDDL